MSGLSRMGQNCFGVGTPILSPLPPAGKTAATAGALHPASAPAPLSKEAEAAKSAPHKPRRRRPASAGPEPPGGHDSMAASGGAGPPRPGPLRLGSAPALGWGRSGEGGQGQSAHTDSAHPSRAGQAVVRPQGTIPLPVFLPARLRPLSRAQRPGRAGFPGSRLLLWQAQQSLQVEVSALPIYLRVSLNLNSCAQAVVVRTPSHPSPLEEI